MKNKKTIGIFILIASLVIIGLVIIFLLRSDNSHKNEDDKNTNKPPETAELDGEVVTSKTDIYRCYRHNNEKYTSGNVSYEYTKYYEFFATDSIIDKAVDRMVYIYKFADKSSYKKFDVDVIFSDEYDKTITNNDKDLTYKVVSNVSISSKETADKEYTVEEYLELLDARGFKDCKKQ